MVFTDRGAWEAAVGGSFVTEDFNALASAGMSLGTNSVGRIDVEVGGTDPGNNAIGGAFTVNGTQSITLESDTNGSDLQDVSIDFSADAPVIGFGADWVSTTNSGGLTVIIDGMTVEFADHLVSGDGFLGFVSDTAFSSAVFGQVNQATNEIFGLDDLSISSSAAVSEPAVASLLGLGLLGAFAATRRRRSRSV